MVRRKLLNKIKAFPQTGILNIRKTRKETLRKPNLRISLEIIDWDKKRFLGNGKEVADINPHDGRILDFIYYGAGDAMSRKPFIALLNPDTEEEIERLYPNPKGQYSIAGERNSDGTAKEDQVRIWFTIPLPPPATAHSDGPVELGNESSDQASFKNVTVRHVSGTASSEVVEVESKGAKQTYKPGNKEEGATDLLGFGKDGDDQFIFDGVKSAVYVDGGNGNDVIKIVNSPTGKIENSVLIGGNGKDNLQAGAGDDNVDGGQGSDNLLGGKGSDYISGETGNDYIDGGSGSDTLDGSSGADKIFGRAGGDAISGGSGGDHISGGTGDDVIVGDSAFSSTEEISVATVEPSSSADTISGGAGEDLILGEWGNDRINGGSGNDEIYGGPGDDAIDGGLGDDTMSGGNGNDVFRVDSRKDIIIEQINEGIDTVKSLFTYMLGDNLENLTLIGREAINGTGNEVDNDILGNKFNNRLYGKAGDDYLDGYFGDDFLYGGEGDDTLVGTLGKDRLIGEAGNDTLDAGLFSNIQGINPLYPSTVEARYLDGGAGDDKLYGGLGNDNLRGGLGDDTMSGWKGDDVYHVDSVGDNINESINSGVDTVFASVNYTLSNHVETLVLRDSVYQGTGNSFNNTIRGNSSNNLLEGFAGDDDLDGYYGNDILKGGDGNDDLNGGYDNDDLTGGSGNDRLAGNNGDDLLSGGLGNDLLLGGAGKDTFTFNSVLEGLDTITDFSQLEEDTIQIVNSGFGGGLAAGAIASSQFVLGTASVNADSRFIYDKPSGSLLFDVDGTGTAVATQIAILSNNADLAHGDIVVI